LDDGKGIPPVNNLALAILKGSLGDRGTRFNPGWSPEKLLC